MRKKYPHISHVKLEHELHDSGYLISRLSMKDNLRLIIDSQLSVNHIIIFSLLELKKNKTEKKISDYDLNICYSFECY